MILCGKASARLSRHNGGQSGPNVRPGERRRLRPPGCAEIRYFGLRLGLISGRRIFYPFSSWELMRVSLKRRIGVQLRVSILNSANAQVKNHNFPLPSFALLVLWRTQTKRSLLCPICVRPPDGDMKEALQSGRIGQTLCFGQR